MQNLYRYYDENETPWYKCLDFWFIIVMVTIVVSVLAVGIIAGKISPTADAQTTKPVCTCACCAENAPVENTGCIYQNPEQ